VLARDVDLDQHGGRGVPLELGQRRVGGERVDQAHMGRNVLHLPALDPADEVPLEQPGVIGALGGEVLGAVLPHQLDARLGQRRQLRRRDVLDRGADLDSRRVAARGGDPLPDSVEVRAHARRVEAGDELHHQARQTIPHWRPVTPPSRRCEK
jgi:hypothetical protein